MADGAGPERPIRFAEFGGWRFGAALVVLLVCAFIPWTGFAFKLTTSSFNLTLPGPIAVLAAAGAFAYVNRERLRGR